VVAAEGDEVELAGVLVPFEALRHGGILAEVLASLEWGTRCMGWFGCMGHPP
jgi:hypothetical protein